MKNWTLLSHKKGNSEQNIGEEVRLSDSAGVYRAGNII